MFFIFVFSNFAELEQGGHLLRENCNRCHLATTNITSANAYMLIDSQEILCQGCHESSQHNSHPSGLLPSISIPAPFVVDWKGELTCSSCHNIHGMTHQMNRSDKYARQYCLSCHEPNFFESMADEGSSLMGFVHLDRHKDESLSRLDEFSIQCIQCHDELSGSLSVGFSENMMRHNGNGNSHPIGQLYRDAERRGHYVPIEMLNPLIDLPDGKVGCTSCHVSYSKMHGKLVIGNQGSNLCMECHDL